MCAEMAGSAQPSAYSRRWEEEVACTRVDLSVRKNERSCPRDLGLPARLQTCHAPRM
jgi:hypothetical protein